jgi:hypothetical protein
LKAGQDFSQWQRSKEWILRADPLQDGCNHELLNAVGIGEANGTIFVEQFLADLLPISVIESQPLQHHEQH